RGGTLEIKLQNDLSAPIVLNCHGLDGVPAAEPLAAQSPIVPGAMGTFAAPLRHAGTLLCDFWPLADGADQARRPLPLVVEEADAVAADRDQICLIEEFRLHGDGSPTAPSQDPKSAMVVYTVNGEVVPDIAVRSGERLRFRFINGCQRSVVAVKVEGHEVRAMALDGQPAEPFSARNSALVLAPGGRVDAFIDAANSQGTTSSVLLHDGKESRPLARLITSSEAPVRPAPLPPAPALPGNGLPAQLDLR